MNEIAPAVHLGGIVKRYGPTTAVAGVDLSIGLGRRVALLGLNGAGKTTLISMILGLLAPDAGTVRVHGLPPEQAVRQGLVGAMLQSSRVPRRVTVAEVVRLATRLCPADRPGDLPVADLLATTGLAELAGRRVERLSGGEVQRLKFAVAVAGRPRLLMLDEPTTAMDVPSRQAFWRQMEAYADGGRTVVYCTHLMDEAAKADEIVVMRAGRIVARGTPSQLERAVGATRVSVTAQVLDPDGLPGVRLVEVAGGRTYLTTDDPDGLVCALAARRLIHELRVEPAGLDLAFLALAQPPTETPAPEPMELTR